MLFFKDKNTGKEYLSLVEDGSKQNYECIFSACHNPTCTCMAIDIDLTFMPDHNHEDLPKSCHSVEFDLDRRKLHTSPKKDLPSEEKAFGSLLLSQLGEDDFEFLEIKHFACQLPTAKAGGLEKARS